MKFGEYYNINESKKTDDYLKGLQEKSKEHKDTAYSKDVELWNLDAKYRKELDAFLAPIIKKFKAENPTFQQIQKIDAERKELRRKSETLRDKATTFDDFRRKLTAAPSTWEVRNRQQRRFKSDNKLEMMARAILSSEHKTFHFNLTPNEWETLESMVYSQNPDAEYYVTFNPQNGSVHVGDSADV